MAFKLERLIRDVPDFPKPGILFKDITPLLADAAALSATIDALVEPYTGKGVELICGTESRGFIFAAAAAVKLGVGFVPIRKPGKLPWKTIREEYSLEYGTDGVEVHCDAIRPGQRILMVDDLLATGGTMAACCKLVEKLGGKVVGVTFVIELAFLPGREKLAGYDVRSLVKVKG
jgi:adenine phosphoribosyltransferase